jgi:hypothetical protein
MILELIVAQHENLISIKEFKPLAQVSGMKAMPCRSLWSSRSCKCWNRSIVNEFIKRHDRAVLLGSLTVPCASLWRTKTPTVKSQVVAQRELSGDGLAKNHNDLDCVGLIASCSLISRSNMLSERQCVRGRVNGTIQVILGFTFLESLGVEFQALLVATFRIKKWTSSLQRSSSSSNTCGRQNPPSSKSQSATADVQPTNQIQKQNFCSIRTQEVDGFLCGFLDDSNLRAARSRSAHSQCLTSLTMSDPTCRNFQQTNQIQKQNFCSIRTQEVDGFLCGFLDDSNL